MDAEIIKFLNLKIKKLEMRLREIQCDYDDIVFDLNIEEQKNEELQNEIKELKHFISINDLKN